MKRKFRMLIASLIVLAIACAYIPTLSLAKSAIESKVFNKEALVTLKGEFEKGQAIIMYKKKDEASISIKTKKIGGMTIKDTMSFEDAKVESPMSAMAPSKGKAVTEDLEVSLVTSNSYSTEKMITELKKDSKIIYAEPNYKVKANAITNDTYEPYQWAIENNGQNAGTQGFDINPKKGTVTTKNKIVAIVDTGLDYNQSEFSGIVWENPFSRKILKGDHGYDFAYGTDDPLDDNGHGTHCAGIIAAASGNSSGITGAVMGNSSVKIMPLKFLDIDGSGELYGAIGAYNYIYKAQQLYEEAPEKETEIVCVSNSWGGGGDEEESQVMAEVIELVGSKGAISVCAAGNEMVDTDEFFNLPSGISSEYVISVAASNEKDELTNFSNYGKNTVDIAAPGADILSTVSYNTFNPSIYSSTQKTNLVDTTHYNDFTSGTNNLTTQVSSGTVSTTNKKYFGKRATSNQSLSWKIPSITEDTQAFLAIPYEATDASQHFSMMATVSCKNVEDKDYDYYPVASCFITYLDKNIDEIDFSQLDTHNLMWETEGLNLLDATEKGNYWDHLELTGKTGGTILFAIYSVDDLDEIEVNIDDIGYSKIGASEDDFGKYDFYNGTSMATPYVSAAVAMASCEYPKEDPFDRKSRILGSVRLSDDLKGKMVSPGVIDISKLDNPFPVIHEVWMSDNTVYIRGSHFGSNPTVYVNETLVPSTLEDGTITFDGTAYRNQYVEIKVKTGGNEVVRYVYLSAGTPYEYESYNSDMPVYSMTTDGNDMYIYSNQNELFRIGLNGTNNNYDGKVVAFGDDDEWMGDDDDDDVYGDLIVDQLESPQAQTLFGVSSSMFGEDEIRFLDSDLVYLNGSLYGIFSIDLGYTVAKSIGKYSIEYNYWSKLMDIPLNAYYDHQTLAAYNGELYVIGGFDGDLDEYVKDVYKVNMDERTFTKHQSLPEGRGYSKAIQYGNKLVVVLGASNDEEVPETLTFNGSVWRKSSAALAAVDKEGERIYKCGIAATKNGVAIVGCLINGIGDTCLYDVANDRYVNTEYSLGNVEPVTAVTAVGEKLYAMEQYYGAPLRSVYVESGLKTMSINKSSEGAKLYIGNFDQEVNYDLQFVPGTISELVAMAENDDYFIKKFTVNGVEVNPDENGYYYYRGAITDDTEVVLKAGKNVGATKMNDTKTKQTKDSITVYWNKATGANGYRVYLYNSTTKKFESKGDTEGTSLKITGLKAATTYKVKVRGYYDIDGDKSYGAYSSEMKATTAPATPKIKVTPGSKKATIKWGKITGASGYDVRMATSKSGTYKTIKTIAKGSTVSFTKTGLTKGKTYYFKVRAYKTVNGKKIYGAYSTVVSAKIK